MGCHAVPVDNLHLNFDLGFLINIVELIPVSNSIQTFQNPTFPLQVSIQTCSINEKWLFLGFASFLGFKKSASTFNFLLLLELILVLDYICIGLWFRRIQLESLSKSFSATPRFRRSTPYVKLSKSDTSVSGSQFLFKRFYLYVKVQRKNIYWQLCTPLEIWNWTYQL